MSKENSGASDTVSASVGRWQEVGDGPRVVGIGHFVHKDPEGRVIDEWTEHNMVVNVGRENYLKAQLKGDDSVQASSWFVGLIAGESTGISLSTTDTSTSVSWSESTGYSEATRPLWDSGAVGSTAVATVSNSSAVATFTIDQGTTAGGVFLGSSNTKGGTAYTLHSQITFSNTRSMSSGDTLDVTYTQQITT